MNRKLFALLLLPAAAAHASRVEPEISAVCTYRNPAATQSVPEPSACTMFEVESTHVFEPEKGRLVSHGGTVFTLADGRQLNVGSDYVMPSKSGEESGQWEKVNDEFNGLPYRKFQRGGFACVRSAKEELCWRRVE